LTWYGFVGDVISRRISHIYKFLSISEMVKLMKVIPAKAKAKKWSAYFMMPDGKEKVVSFGASGYRDYTLISDKKSKFYLPKKADREKVKAAYIKRHSKEDQTNPMKPATLSRYILWSTPSLGGSIRNFKKRFKV